MDERQHLLKKLRGQRYYDKLTPEQKLAKQIQGRPSKKEYAQQKRDNETKKERDKRNEERRVLNISEIEKDLLNATNRSYRKNKRDNETVDQREDRLAKAREYRKQKLLNETFEQRICNSQSLYNFCR